MNMEKKSSFRKMNSGMKQNRETREICKNLFNFLKTFEIRPNQERHNVRREGHDKLRSMTFGEVLAFGSSDVPEKHFTRRYEISRVSRDNPELHRVLMEFGRMCSGKKFTSCCVNDSYQMAKHRDKHNVGESFIVGLGDYTGGELRIFREGGSKDYDIRKGVFFDGYKYFHEVLPFEGRRYSLVYFNCGSKKKTLTKSINGKFRNEVQNYPNKNQVHPRGRTKKGARRKQN